MKRLKFSPSAAPRWWHDRCPRSVQRCSGVRPEQTQAAIEGTAAHAAAEYCLKTGFLPEHLIESSFNDLTITEEISEYLSEYISLVTYLTAIYNVKPKIEFQFKLNSVDDGTIKGIGDTVFHVPDKRLIHILDFKYGLRSVDDYHQLKMYAIGVLDTFDAWDQVDQIHGTIVQPRYDHRDGPVRTQTWTTDQIDDFADEADLSIQIAKSPDAPAKTGSWCYYCPRRAVCPERAYETIRLAYPDQSEESISTHSLEEIYSQKGVIESQLKALEKALLSRSQRGDELNKFKRVWSSPRRSVVNIEDFIEHVEKETGVKKDQLFKRVLKNNSDLAKLVGKDLLEKFLIGNQPRQTLTSKNSNRVEIPSKSQRTNQFDIIES